MSEELNKIVPDDVDNGQPYIFVSYASKDMKETQAFLQILRRSHFRFWYDQGLKSGSEWAAEIEEKIDRCEQFVVLISDNAVNSKFVRKEVGLAVDGDKNILVVYLSETILNGGLRLLLSNIQAIHRENFSNENFFALAVCDNINPNIRITYDIENNYGDKSEGWKKFTEEYIIASCIGQGGSGCVYKGIQKGTWNSVAIKVVDFNSIDQKFLEYVVARVHSEKEILSKVSCCGIPYVPVLIDWYECDDCFITVESLVKGTSMTMSARSGGNFSETEAVEIAKKIAYTLRRLHANGIVHGDIKPNNLMIDNYGDIYIIDFDSAHKSEDIPIFRTRTNIYAAPELSKYENLTNFSTDIYALGRTIDYLLCPQMSVYEKRVHLRRYRKDISPELDSLLDRMASELPEHRFQNVDELLLALENYKKVSIVKKISLRLQSLREDYNLRAMIRRFKGPEENEQIVDVSEYGTLIVDRRK